MPDNSASCWRDTAEWPTLATHGERHAADIGVLEHGQGRQQKPSRQDLQRFFRKDSSEEPGERQEARSQKEFEEVELGADPEKNNRALQANESPPA